MQSPISINHFQNYSSNMIVDSIEINHYHTWNDSAPGLVGATINGTCIGDHACAGPSSGSNNDGPGSVNTSGILNYFTCGL